ncbi:hypothetical protein [Bradyrhizobium sp. NBAIM01]|uniref:hypothetical protein n=1 Tax=Bradyrhizobium sp. NBAIM01 TaxID=2793818 RepID=UPI001CD50DB4|nr:hypothetical protein [Bradyrhizobium sp. NBAIM01]MCA1511480.1 hypothetical protein [Bradyrhizobium sp. NBAIM01]
MTAAEPGTAHQGVGWRIVATPFPNAAIVSDPERERRIINWVWATVPLQYYTLTRYAGALKSNEWLGIIVSVSSCMLLILLVSFVLSRIVPMQVRVAVEPKLEREVKLRAWSVALITHWAAAVTLIAISFFLGDMLVGKSEDLVQQLFCRFVVACHNHPELLSGATISIFLIYSVLAMALVFSVLRFGRSTTPTATVPAPYALAVIAISTMLLDLLHSAAKWH